MSGARGRASVRGHGGAVGGGAGGAAGSRRQVPARRRAAWPVEGCGCRSAGRGERGGSQAAPRLRWAGRWQPRAPSCGGSCRALSLFAGPWRGSWRVACSRCCLCVVSVVAGLGDGVGKRGAPSGWEVLLLASLCGVLLQARSATARSCGWRGLMVQQGWQRHRLPVVFPSKASRQSLSPPLPPSAWLLWRGSGCALLRSAVQQEGLPLFASRSVPVTS